jgi:chemotaxis protein MotB
MALPEDDPPPGVPEWVVTYGDMMSLLLTFFIMLVSMSEIKQEGKVRSALDSMEQRFGPTDGRYGAPGASLQENSSNPHAASTGRSSEGGTQRSGINSEGLAGKSTTVKRIGGGTLITLGGPCLFERLDAQLTDGMQQDLQTISQVLAGRPNKIVVRGHATRETLPADVKSKDPWDLSFDRAEAVAKYLIAHGIDENRVQLSAAGDSEPRIVARDKQIQRENRRVDVFVIDEYTSASSATPGGTPTDNRRTAP